MPVQQYSTIMTIMKPFCCFSSCTATEPNQSVHKLQQPILPDACSRIHMVLLTEQHTSSVLAATLCARSFWTSSYKPTTKQLPAVMFALPCLALRMHALPMPIRKIVCMQLFLSRTSTLRALLPVVYPQGCVHTYMQLPGVVSALFMHPLVMCMQLLE